MQGNIQKFLKMKILKEHNGRPNSITASQTFLG
jgi:hypothetical protein